MGKPLGRLDIGSFKRPRPIEGGVELDGEPRAVVLHEGVFLVGVGAGVVVPHPAFGGAFKLVDGRGKTPERLFQSVRRGFASVH